jgi:UDP-N-acetylglucosamine:LPS N-acetylglucosamine transferase
MIDEPLFNAFFELSNKKIKDKTFDEIFQIDKIPLRWFFHTIVTSSTLPQLFINTSGIFKRNPLSITEKIKYFSGAKAFQLALSFLEFRKRHVKKNKTQNDNQKKVLFLTFTNHINNEKDIEETFRIGKIVKYVEQKNIKPFVLVADPVSKFSHKKLKITKNKIYDYGSKKLHKSAKQTANSLTKEWKSLTKDQKEELFTFQDQKSIWPKLKYTMNFLFSKTFLIAVTYYYLIFKEIINDENISVSVVTSMSGFFEKCLFASSKQLDKPVVLIQHGMGGGIMSIDYFISKTKMAVFSDYHKRKWIKAGMDEGDVIVTGPVVFDGIEKYKRQSEPEALNNFLIITQPFVKGGWMTHEEYISKFNKILEQIYITAPEAKITIKLHPRESKDDYKKTRNRFNILIQDSQDRNKFYEAMQNADVIIQFGSTAALEAMVVGTPVITVKLEPTKPIATNELIGEYKAGLICNYNEVKNAIKKLKDILTRKSIEENRKKFVEDFCYKIDGKAASRVSDVIEKLHQNISE